MNVTHAYLGEITKTEKTPDGDLLVYGKATGPDLDLDEQRCDPEWLKSAMPGWAQWSNIREQHSAIAAGVGVETVQDGDDWYVKSLVVDAGSARKVEKGVLKGYSIGIKNARVVKDATAPGGRIIGGEIVEISLVDRPCNPTAMMAIAKSAGDGLAPVDVAGELVMDLTKAVIVEQNTGATGAERSPSSKAAGFDRAAALADVRSILDGTLTGPVLDKSASGYDESADIAGAREVIARIAALIQSEAASLAEGRTEEAWDIQILLDANASMACFLRHEVEQQGGPSSESDDVTYVGLAATVTPEQVREVAESVKYIKDFEAKLREFPLASAAPAANDSKIDGQDSNKSAIVESSQAAEPDGVTLVEALAVSEERVKTLEADLAKAKAQPIPGGPAVMRVTATSTPQTTKTAPDAEHYRRMAEAVDDPRARIGYLQLAEQAAKSAESD